MSSKHHKNRVKIGGKVIASGGYGCVFNPALRCKGKNRVKNKISKLMTKKHYPTMAIPSIETQANHYKSLLHLLVNGSLREGWEPFLKPR